ncbi:trehalose-phosphatase [Brevundimonas sp. SORGH_AS_0993]|uniref:trehalose-phosphatase n=1 Tax=Brevundimonas sp. SORGH_AS_0993 TaxID=3041794 RepID=UPI00277DB9CA|nr:trehalose-phosphatase [Brevundimonas sp. SORGH_AS_0993]MDQ1154648.1 trehalose 6-phosphate phosphatase [Brevundimonas sp. SORGH_AS_0993]
MTSHARAADLILPSPPVRAEGVALFLDMDGVLAPLAATPDAVVPSPRRTAALKAVAAKLDGRVAIVSGRTISEIDRIADHALMSASGVHGLERRLKDGTIQRKTADAGVAQALRAFKLFAADRPGMIVEDKGVSAGLHYRQAPDQAKAAEDLAHRLQAETGLTLQPGHMVLELKTPGADKGTAVTAFMQEAPFKGAAPVMLGDDLTDEYGFEAAAALGGYGVLVGPERPTAARYRLEDVDAVLIWLEAVAGV